MMNAPLSILVSLVEASQYVCLAIFPKLVDSAWVHFLCSNKPDRIFHNLLNLIGKVVCIYEVSIDIL